MTTKRTKNKDQIERLRGTGLVTVEEAARRAGVAERTIYNYLTTEATGPTGSPPRFVVKSVRVGSRVFVDLRSLAAHLGAEGAALLGLDAPAEPDPTHPFTGSGDRCAYDWPNGDEPSEPCGLTRKAHEEAEIRIRRRFESKPA